MDQDQLVSNQRCIFCLQSLTMSTVLPFIWDSYTIISFFLCRLVLVLLQLMISTVQMVYLCHALWMSHCLEAAVL
uniref:Uncharacterized protein n=1 Tax=Rhizophora mucronata TaxID=61149 RepID=A0A2P2K9C0_RHIMU